MFPSRSNGKAIPLGNSGFQCLPPRYQITPKQSFISKSVTKQEFGDEKKEIPATLWRGHFVK